MRFQLAVAAVALGVLAAGCGGDDRRLSVERYVTDVNAVHGQLRQALNEASFAYREYTTDGADLAELRPRLVRAERSIRTLDARLATLEPPDEARRLHVAMRDLVGAEAALADELERLSVFLPQFEVAVEPLHEANARLERGLTGADEDVEQQAKVLDVFRADTGEVLDDVEQLEPPPVMNPVHVTQVRTLERVRTTAASLATALRRDRSVAPPLVRRFAEAQLSSRSVAAQRAQIAAVRSYNRRAATIGTLTQAVQREFRRLDADLR